MPHSTILRGIIQGNHLPSRLTYQSHTVCSMSPRPTTLNFITSNKNKLSEVRAILSTIPNLELNSSSLDLAEIQGTIEEIASDKASRAAEQLNAPVLTEDTALEFNALKGLPGPYIKYFLTALGHEGLNNLLLAYEDKSAVTVCTFAFCEGPGSKPVLFQGKTDGKIVPARGPGIFGWDAVFEYKGETYAEMDKDKKVGNAACKRTMCCNAR
jgi:inosine triphosphate pyrophosphatase